METDNPCVYCDGYGKDIKSDTRYGEGYDRTVYKKIHNIWLGHEYKEAQFCAWCGRKLPHDT